MGKRFLRRGLNSSAQADFYEGFIECKNAINKEMSFLKKDFYNFEIKKAIIEYMYWGYKIAKNTPNEGQEISFKKYLHKKFKELQNCIN